jgi:hypothetical protein
VRTDRCFQVRRTRRAVGPQGGRRFDVIVDALGIGHVFEHHFAVVHLEFAETALEEFESAQLALRVILSLLQEPL